ncbi:hypothetical protein ATH84_1010120 [Paracoccus versutus]|uniref:Uncharacterized protein n=1 Tax=Paracoccus versutus TaxID=34007 RepID=A0AAQ0HKP8_PARVE|nr:hypothetical protein ATH84_1010120 [Paracoccus versutus]
MQGRVDIAGSTIEPRFSPVAAEGWSAIAHPYTIIDNQGTGAVSGTFAAVNRNLLFLDPQLNHAGGDGNDVTLELVRNDVSFASLARTANQSATGRGIDALPRGYAVWNTVALMSDENAVRRGLDLLSGEIHASALARLFEEGRFPRLAFADRFRLAAGTDPGSAFWTRGHGHRPIRTAVAMPPRLNRTARGCFLGSTGRWTTGGSTSRRERTDAMQVGTDRPATAGRIGERTKD